MYFLPRALVVLALLFATASAKAQCASPLVYELGGASGAVCNAIFNHQALARGRFIDIVQTNVSPPVVKGAVACDYPVVHMHTEIVSRIWATDGENIYGINTDDPFNPILMGRLLLPAAADPIRRIRVRGSFVYALSSRWLYIVDISAPAAPVLRSATQFNADELLDVQVVGSYAYLCGFTNPACSLIVVNIASPVSPSEVARIGPTTTYRLALPPGSGSLYAMASNAGTNGGLNIWSLSNPAQPSLLAVNTTITTHQYDEFLVGSTALVKLENFIGGMFRVRICNPSTLASQGTSSALPWSRAITLDPPRVLVAENYGGMDIINIATPTSPVTTVRALDRGPGGAFDIEGDGGGYTVMTGHWNGAWFMDTSVSGPPVMIRHIYPTDGSGDFYSEVAILNDFVFLLRQNNNQTSVVEAYQVVVGANRSVTLRGSFNIQGWVWGLDAGFDQNNTRRVYFTVGGQLRILNAANPGAMSQTGAFALTPGAGDVLKFIPAGLFPPTPPRIIAGDDYEFGAATQIVNVSSSTAPTSMGVIPAPADCIAFASSHAWLLKGDTVRVFDISTPATPVLRNAFKVAPAGDRGVGFRFTDPLAGGAMVLTERGRLVRLSTGNPGSSGPTQLLHTLGYGAALTFVGARLHAASGALGCRVFNTSFSASPAENPSAPLTSRTICPGAPMILSASFLAMPAPTAYRWYKGTTPLSDGPTGSGSTLSGAATPTLTITAPGPGDVGAYFCRAANQCGANDSSTAIITECYANCDCSAAPPILSVADFTCFLQRYASGESYANCDNSTATPVLNVQDFTCFLQRYAAGCP